MNKKLILISLLSLGLAASPAAMAKHDRDDDRYQSRHDDRGHDRGHDRGDDRHDRDDRGYRDNGWRGERERYWHGDRYVVSRYQPPRSYTRHYWHAGDRLPVVYRSTRYVVNDYRSYRLQAPPRGHHWVRVDNDVVLTAVTTGVVAAVVYGLFN